MYEYLLEGVMPKRLTTSQRQYLAQWANHLCFKKEYCIDLDKITCFVKFYNWNKYPQFCRNTQRSYKRTFLFWYHYAKDPVTGSAKECKGMNPHTPKWTPCWELEFQWTSESLESITGVKTHWFKEFFKSLEIYWNLNV